MIKTLAWTPLAFQDYNYFQQNEKRLLKRINYVVSATNQNPYGGPGKPIPLTGDLEGYWSRRIDDIHRLLYKVEQGQLTIISCRYHY